VGVETIVTLVCSAALAGRQVRRRRRLRRWTAVLEEEGPHTGITPGLSPRLRGLVEQARILRMVLATPLRRVGTPVFETSPSRRRERCAAYDQAVVELRRAIWEWRRGFGRLDPHEQSLLRAAGVFSVPLADVLLHGLDRTGDPWEQHMWVRGPQPREVAGVLRRVDAELRRFEQALLVAPQGPYRAAA
jgi:hypothetical protein